MEEVSAVSGDPGVVTRFRYENTGSKPVRIIALRSNCSCLTAESSAPLVGPGEAGFVQFTLDLTGRFGRLQKEVAVVTDDAPDAPTTLTLRVGVAEVVTCSPRLVIWRVGEPAAEKTIDIDTVAPRTITAIEPPPLTPAISNQLRLVEPGRKYRLYLKPASTAQPMSVPLRCLAQIAGRPPVEVLVYAMVR